VCFQLILVLIGTLYKGLVLVFRNIAILEKRDAGVAETFLSIIQQVAEHRQQNNLTVLKVVVARIENLE
jgi:hypothetical protein